MPLLRGKFHTPDHDIQLHIGIRKLKIRKAGGAKKVGATRKSRGGQLIIHGFFLTHERKLFHIYHYIPSI